MFCVATSFSPRFLLLIIIIQDRTIVQQSIYLANIVPYYGALCFNNNNKWQILLYTHKKIKEIYIFEHFLQCALDAFGQQIYQVWLWWKRFVCACVGIWKATQMSEYWNWWSLNFLLVGRKKSPSSITSIKSKHT